MKNEKKWLAVILLIAAFLRFWNLEGMPPGLYHDEAYNGLDALSLVQGKTFPQFYEGWELYAQDAHAERAPTPTRFPVFFEGNYGREPLHVYLMAVSVWLFGNRPFAIRAVPALAGVLAVLATWFTTKQIWKDEKELPPPFSVPLLAAFVIAILFPAIHFSRFGLRAMLFVPVECMAVYCFWRGYQLTSPTRSRWGWFIATGFFVGFGLYIYAAARLLPLLFVGFIGYCLWHEADKRMYYVKVLGVIGLTAVLTATPLLLFFYQFPYFFIFRIGYVANKGKGTVDGQPILTWLFNVGRVIRGLFWQGETHLRHNLPGRPYLDIIQSGGFVWGLAYLVRQRLRPQTVMILLWLLVMLLPTIMSGDAPHFGRMTGALPAIGIFAGLGLQQMGKRWPRVTLSLLLISLAWTTFSYFIQYGTHPDLPTDFYMAEWQLGQQMADTDATLYLAPTQEEMATLYFALDGDVNRLGSFSGGAIPLGIPQESRAYFVRPDQEALLAQLEPLGERHLLQHGAVLIMGETAVLPTSYTPSTHTFDHKIRLAGWSHHAGEQEVTIQLYWETVATMTTNYTAYIHLVDETGQIIYQVDRPPTGYPTTDWRIGEWVTEQYQLPLPTHPYDVRIGFYDLATSTPLGDPYHLSLDEPN